MICEATNGQIDNPSGRRIAGAVVHETVAVAKARGLILDADVIMATVSAALVDHRHHKPSMLQDREHGRATEIEAINGAILREGERLGVPTPVCATLADLVRLIEQKSAV
jgi:2-dehydropantoate 2-reductase